MSNDILASAGLTITKVRDGEQTFTWFKYADDKHGNGLSDLPEDKKYIGLAFNQPTPDGSNNPDDYKWSDLPQNMEIGGRNLVLDSRNGDAGWTSSGYVVAEGQLAEDWAPGKTYTATIKGTPSGSSFSIARDSGTVNQGNFTYDPDKDVWIYIFIAENTPEADKNTFTLYDEGYSGAGSSIDWIKIERGNVSTDWTRAIEDTEKEIDNVRDDIYDVNLKIEPEKIISTVTRSSEYTNDLGELVKKNEIASTFEQTEQTMLLSAKHIDLNGAVSFSSFDPELKNSLDDTQSRVQEWRWGDTTKIDGGNIYTGSITTDQIEAKSITAEKINIDELSAVSANLGKVTTGIISSSDGTSTIDLTNGTFSFAGGKIGYNGSGLALDADDINLDGKVTFDSLNTNLKNTVETTQEEASTAKADASVAQTTADSAISAANTASSTASAAKEKTDAWSYDGTTEIDGASIRTDTLSADKITGRVPGEKITLDGDVVVNGTFKVGNTNINSGIEADKITAGVMHGDRIQANTLSVDRITGRITGEKITLDGDVTVSGTFKVGNINISSGIEAGKITTGTMHGNRIQANTLSANRINTDTLSAITANLGTVTAGTLKSQNGKSEFRLNDGVLETMDTVKQTLTRISDGMIEQRTDIPNAGGRHHGFTVDASGLGLYYHNTAYGTSPTNIKNWDAVNLSNYAGTLLIGAPRGVEINTSHYGIDLNLGVGELKVNGGASVSGSLTVGGTNVITRLNSISTTANSASSAASSASSLASSAYSLASGKADKASSTNGYIKMEDGTLINWHSSFTLTYDNSNRLSANWSFNVNFSGNPTVVATREHSHDTTTINTSSIGTSRSTNSVLIRMFNNNGESYPTGTTTSVRVIAIGRWFG